MHHIHNDFRTSLGFPFNSTSKQKRLVKMWAEIYFILFFCRSPPSDATPEKMEIHGGYISPEDLE